MMTLAPNLEMALYLAQATGSCIVTDNRHRWNEIQQTLLKPTGWLGSELPALADGIGRAPFAFPRHTGEVESLYGTPALNDYRAVMRDSLKYLQAARRRA